MPLERVKRLIVVLVSHASKEIKPASHAHRRHSLDSNARTGRTAKAGAAQHIEKNKMGGPTSARCCYSLFCAALRSVVLQHLARFAAAFSRADDTFFFHQVDQACGARVA